MAGWFRHIQIFPEQPSRVRRRVARLAKARRQRRGQREYEITSEKPAPKPVRLSKLHLTIRGRRFKVDGDYVYLYSIADIAKLYDLDQQTVRRWYERSFLPDPVITLRRGRGQQPLYLRSQVRVIAIVLNDIYRQGIKILPFERLEEHKKMLWEGNARLLERLGNVSPTKRVSELGGKHRVMWDR